MVHALPVHQLALSFTAGRDWVQFAQVNKARLLGGVVFAGPTDTVYYRKGAPKPHLQSLRPGQQEFAQHIEGALSIFIGVLAAGDGTTSLVPDDEKACHPCST